MDKERNRIKQDFSLAISDLEFGGGVTEHPVFQEFREAYAELVNGSEKVFNMDWEIVYIDESHIYVTNLKTGNRYHISVIYPAALYVDVYRILENGEEIIF